MTQKQIERLVKDWQKRLRLDHWEIRIDWNSQAASIAENERSNFYDSAIIRLGTAWPTWSADYAEQTIVHELLHCHDRDLQQAVKALEGDQTWATHEIEGLVDRLAMVLVSLV